MSNTRTPKKVCSRIGFALFCMLLLWQGLSYTLLFILPQVAPQLARGEWTLYIVNYFSLYLVAVPVFWLIIRPIPEVEEDVSHPKMQMTALRFIALVFFSFGVMYGLNFFTNILTNILDILKEEMGIGGYATQGSIIGNGFWGNVLFVACVPAVGEEFIFRFLLKKKMRGSGDKAFILVSGVCFALFHANIAQIFYAFGAGCTFAWVYTRTGKLVYSVILHFLINFTSVAVSQLPITDIYNLSSSAFNYLALLGLWIIIAVITAIVLLAVNFRKVQMGLAPPSEEGWPYKAPPVKYYNTPYYYMPPRYPPNNGSYYPSYPPPAYGSAPPTAPSYNPVQPHQASYGYTPPPQPPVYPTGNPAGHTQQTPLPGYSYPSYHNPAQANPQLPNELSGAGAPPQQPPNSYPYSVPPTYQGQSPNHYGNTSGYHVPPPQQAEMQQNRGFTEPGRPSSLPPTYGGYGPAPNPYYNTTQPSYGAPPYGQPVFTPQWQQPPFYPYTSAPPVNMAYQTEGSVLKTCFANAGMVSYITLAVLIALVVQLLL